jgi:hypothetical protein
LNAFNDGIAHADPYVPPTVPVVAVIGSDDRTADPDWHLPWLRDRVATLDLRTQQGVGHMLHHMRPVLALGGGPGHHRSRATDPRDL